MAKQTPLTYRQQIRAIASVAAMTFRTAPAAVIFKLIGSIINAVLPIVTTYYAARTTTALASAYAGNAAAHDQVLIYVIITASLGLIMTVWSSFDSYVQSKMRYVVETRISNKMFEQFLSLDFWRYDDKETADLYDRSQKFSIFFAYIFDRIATIISQFIGIVSAVIALFYVNWGIALFILVAIIPGMVVQFKLSRRQIKVWNENVEVRRSIGLIEWNMFQPRLISELRLYGMVDYLLKLRTKLRDKDERKRIEIERDMIPLTLLSNVIEALAEVVALIWISLQIIGRQQPIGQFLYVQQIVGRAISSTSAMISTISSIDEDIANLYDYERFMRLPPHTNGTVQLTEQPHEIIVRDVSFKYPGKQSKEVLKDINLTIKQHEHIAIVGENGAGKSTLIKLLTGLYHPTTGSVLVDGESLKDIDIYSWHRLLSVLQQDFIAYEFATARENVRYGDVDKPYDETQMKRALDAAEATEFTNKLANGLDSYVNNWMEDSSGQKGADLSGGQWQRLALARNFYRDAPIIVLDEPTSAIDALAEARIFKNLFDSRKHTVITISHRLSTVKKADQIYMLENGSIVESGTYAELIARKGAFYHMFESQLS